MTETKTACGCKGRSASEGCGPSRCGAAKSDQGCCCGPECPCGPGCGCPGSCGCGAKKG